MIDRLRSLARGLEPEPRAVAEGLADLLERHALPQLDRDASTATADRHGLDVSLRHVRDPEVAIGVAAYGRTESIVTYGPEHLHFRATDRIDGRVWPFPADDHVQAILSLTEALVLGRVELHVWVRPLALRTRSYWIDETGTRRLFTRGSTLGPFWGWSRHPTVRRFDFVE